MSANVGSAGLRPRIPRKSVKRAKLGMTGENSKESEG